MGKTSTFDVDARGTGQPLHVQREQAHRDRGLDRGTVGIDEVDPPFATRHDDTI